MNTNSTSTPTYIPPVMSCWNLVKDLDDSEKLELVEMLLDSLKPVVARAQNGTTEHELRPYTMDEINAMIDAAEADIAAGRLIDDEDAWEEDFILMDRRKKEMAEAV